MRPQTRALIQAIHIAREILWTLRNRPIGYGNSSFIDDCLLSLSDLCSQIAGSEALLAVDWGASARTFARELAAMVQAPSAQRIKQLLIHADQRIGAYHAAFRAPIACDSIPPGALAGRRYRRIVVVTGPGLGIGDEIIFAPFLWELIRHSGTAPEMIEIFSFSPDVWQVLGAAGAVKTLVGNPMAGYRRIDAVARLPSEGPALALFANFSGQQMFRAFQPGHLGIDCLELSIGKGQAWLLRHDDAKAATAVALNQVNPSLRLALDDLLMLLLGRHWKPDPRRSAIARVRPATSGAPFRILLNPFTSKINPMEPAHWADLVGVVREALPPGRRFCLTVHSGVTSNCHAYSRQVVELCLRRGRPEDQIQWLDGPDRQGLTPANGILVTHRAIEETDFLLGMDTYTAHLAALIGVPSIALCLSYNPEFWEKKEHSFWWTIEAGLPALHALTRYVAELMLDAPSFRTAGLRAAHGALFAQGPPGKLLEDPLASVLGRYNDWYRKARSAWRQLPADIQEALIRVDAVNALPRLGDDFVSPSSAHHRSAVARFANSNFFRLACLAGAGDSLPES